MLSVGNVPLIEETFKVFDDNTDDGDNDDDNDDDHDNGNDSDDVDDDDDDEDDDDYNVRQVFVVVAGGVQCHQSDATRTHLFSSW